MRAMAIDDFLEAVEDGRTSETPPLARHQAGDWGRLVEEGRSARYAADGGRWRIGQLAGQVEKRYGAGLLQRFSEEIGESYSTVRRYRWVTSRYDAKTRFRFPTLSFSHFQAVAKLPNRLAWLEKAERGGWSVDSLTRASHGGGSPARASATDARLNSSIEAMRRHIHALAAIDQGSLSADGRKRIGQALIELSAEIRKLQKQLGITAVRPARAAGSR